MLCALRMTGRLKNANQKSVSWRMSESLDQPEITDQRSEIENQQSEISEEPHWLDRRIFSIEQFTVENLLVVLLIGAAIFTRFWLLGDRVMSHDESLHVYFSWNLFKGSGFAHTPLMHGPFKFELIAFLYSLFGADDFTARISVAVFGVLLVATPFFFRRWLGRKGALVMSFMLLISPSIWYHARYIRDEAYMLVWGVLIALAMFKYLHSRSNKWLFFMAVIVALMYTTMEAAFIFVAIYGLFLAVVVLVELSRETDFWRNLLVRTLIGFAGAAVIAVVLLAIHSLLLGALQLAPADPSPFPVAPIAVSADQPIDPGVQSAYLFNTLLALGKVLLALIVPAVLIGVALFFWLKFILPARLRESAAFNVLIVLGQLTLYMASAGLLAILNPIWQQLYHLPYVDVQFFKDGLFPTGDIGLVLRLAICFTTFAALSIAIGLWWNRRRWLITTAIFLGITVTLFTTIFTNGVGLGTGFVGSLGYWLAQQGVQRGSQPIYYYFIVTPIYEYLPILITIAAAIFTTIRSLLRPRSAEGATPIEWDRRLFLPFAFWWVVASWLAYSVAGEKMPWLMEYLALPMIVLSARFLGERLDRVDWRAFRRNHEWALGLLIGAIVIAGSWTIGNLQKAFSDRQLDSLIAFSGWLAALIVFGLAALALWRFRPRPSALAVVRSSGLLALIVLAALTFRTGWIWNYINYDSALEFGVYAHGGAGVKTAMQQIDELSRLTTGGKTIRIAFDADASWPFFWYLRDYTNKAQIGEQPSRSDLEAPIIIASSKNWSTLDSVLRTTYTHAQFHRIWWPMEDYKVFTECPAEEIGADKVSVKVAAYDENNDSKIDEIEKANGESRCAAYSLRHLPDYVATIWNWLIGDAQKRSAMLSIFLNRDYTQYDQIRSAHHTPDNWPLVDEFRLYVRNDLAAQVWTQAAGLGSIVTGTTQGDPYAKGMQDIAAMLVFGSIGAKDGQFASPHGLSIGPDGSIYVADGISTHRVVKFDATSKFVQNIGGPSGENSLNPPPGLFKEPWDVAVASDGSIFVADTWNHRIQHLKPDGTFINAWGVYSMTGGLANSMPGGFYGPRGIAIDPQQRVLVADTGNKRVQIFDASGKFLSAFGGAGLQPGNFDEPVGVAIDVKGNIIVADTWNARIQVLDQYGSPLANWEIDGWLDKDLVGKPYVAVDQQQRVYVADEVGRRVLVFDETGKYLGGFGGIGADAKSFQLPGGIAVDKDGFIYVVDTGTGRVMKFVPFQVRQ
jgi:uncharacterized protein (TIGR03663 family)